MATNRDEVFYGLTLAERGYIVAVLRAYAKQDGITSLDRDMAAALVDKLAWTPNDKEARRCDAPCTRTA